MKKIVSHKYFPTFVLLCAAAILFGSYPITKKKPSGLFNKDIGDLHHYAEGAFESIDKESLKRLKPEVKHFQTTTRPLFALYLFSALFIIVLQVCLGKSETKRWPTRIRSFIGTIWFYAIPALIVYLYITNIEATSALDKLSTLEQMPNDAKYFTILSAYIQLHDAFDSMESLGIKMQFLSWINSILLIIYALACSKRRAQKVVTE